MRLGDILRTVAHESDAGAEAIDIAGVSKDSRAVRPGDLFIAYRGYGEDGFRHIAGAVERGARAVVAEQPFAAPQGVARIIVADTRSALSAIARNFYRDPQESLTVIGITGTNGKTTTSYIIEQMLTACGVNAAVIGTVSYRYAGREIVARNTTPGPLELFRLMREMVDAGCSHLVMEVSSHALDQRRVEGIGYDAAVFTNVTADHLDYHKTGEDYLRAKALLFRHLKRGGVSVLNADDGRVMSVAPRDGRVTTFGTRLGSHMRATDIALSIAGTEFHIERADGARVRLSTSLIGKHNVSNMLAAVTALEALGFDLEALARHASGVKAPPGRLETVEAGQPFKIFVDYAHTEDALRNVLGLLKDVKAAGRIITVFGCGGNRDTTKRPLMGRAACELSERVVVTSDNPRFEDPGAIIGEIEAGIRGRWDNYVAIEDRKTAIEKALAEARSGDIVLIAGKGHEKYQIVKAETLPFDDVAVSRVAVERLLSRSQ